MVQQPVSFFFDGLEDGYDFDSEEALDLSASAIKLAKKFTEMEAAAMQPLLDFIRVMMKDQPNLK